MSLGFDIAGGSGSLSASEGCGRGRYVFAGVPSHRSPLGMTPANVTHQQFDEDTPASRYCVTAPAVSGEGNGPFGQVRQWSRLVNPGNGQLLDAALTLTSGSIESKTVPSYWKGCTSANALIPLNLQGKRVSTSREAIVTNLTRKQVELIAMALKHAKQGVTEPRFAKEQCREIVELLQQIEESHAPMSKP